MWYWTLKSWLYNSSFVIYNQIRERAKKESEDEKLEREIKLDEDNRVIVQKEYLLIISSLFVYK